MLPCDLITTGSGRWIRGVKKTANRQICSIEPDLGLSLVRWFGEPPGSLLLEREQACLEPLLSRLFGYYLLQVGSPVLQAESLPGSRIKQRLMIAPERPEPTPAGWICGDPRRLPVATDSVDAVLLQHTLDFCADPHQVLREADRVLIAEGSLIVLGFNPWSLWGLRRLSGRRSGRIPWCGRFISRHRLQEWLSVLGFELERVESVMFLPPLRQQMLMDSLRFLEQLGQNWWPLLSGVYLIQAVKRVSSLIPIKPAWKLRRAILGGRVIEPTTRNGRG